MSDKRFERPNRPADWYDIHEAQAAQAFACPKDAYFASLQHMPSWTNVATSIRNRVVKPFGLETGASSDLLQNMPVATDTAEIFEAGLVDKHLTFSIEVRFIGETIQYQTNIWYNHLAGRVYLAMVYVPHKIIMRHSANSVETLYRNSIRETEFS